MQTDFEIFKTGPVQKSPDRLHVTINERGHIFLNRRVLEAMGQPDAVTLMFDRSRRIIGIRPTTLSRAHGFVLKKKDTTASRGRMIYAMNFCRHYKITPTETLAFISPTINKDGILMLNLNEMLSAKRI